MKVDIRPETKNDYKQVYEVIAKAFVRNREARMVDALRKTTRFVPELSLAAKHYDTIIGYILFYPVEIVEGGNVTKTLALAPVAVVPAQQRKGVGGKLVKVGLSAAKRLGYGSVVALGHKAFYPRFGFAPASNWHIKAPFNIPEEEGVLMAQELVPGALKNGFGTIKYSKEFEMLTDN